MQQNSQTTFDEKNNEQPTKGFVQLGLDGRTIIGSAYPGFRFGGRNSVGLLLVNFGFYLLIWLQFRADSWLIPQLHKASIVRRYAKSESVQLQVKNYEN